MLNNAQMRPVSGPSTVPRRCAAPRGTGRVEGPSSCCLNENGDVGQPPGLLLRCRRHLGQEEASAL
eukprot:6214189-Pleurochrysis_carterae.AAC.2